VRRAISTLVLGAAAIALLGGCGSTPRTGQAAPTPTVLASADRISPPPTGVPDDVVVLLRNWNTERSQSATVEIARLDGTVLATADFVPPQQPRITEGPVWMTKPVQVAAGAAFFVDNQGAIRKLAMDGSVTVVGELTLRDIGQPDFRFAINPDGTEVLASIFTWPPFVTGTNPGGFLEPEPGAHWFYDLESIKIGQPARSIIARDLGASPPQGQPWPDRQTMVVGWDADGPLATAETQLWGQGMSQPSMKFSGPHLIHLGVDGSQSTPIGGSNCVPIDYIGDIGVACTDTKWTKVWVSDNDGNVVWTAEIGGWGYDSSGNRVWVRNQCCLPVAMAPDGAAVATSDGIFTKQGAQIMFSPVDKREPPIFLEGWLDANTVVGDDYGPGGSTGEPVLFRRSAPADYTHTGLTGAFIDSLH
jgi:hypothetical protein